MKSSLHSENQLFLRHFLMYHLNVNMMPGMMQDPWG